MTWITDRFDIDTRSRTQALNITEQVKRFLSDHDVGDGPLTIYTPHTTTAIAINESEGGFLKDLLMQLEKIVPPHAGYSHDRIDSNADSHILASIIGPSVTIPIEGGRLALGTWQSILFLELDGPRTRRVMLQGWKG